ncbi:E3 ubiquitin-protein ligase COP1-like [Drosophila pseudoobscura]|uniref:E3 ubiquitin-protein ligase COP1-like n=2 Tax=Drosophila pseudoobscura pseudoobscura TaxID=46245 RepID=A0A6I8WD90_DROPS|nr:E3 ubiquitin-protein ligase COP1 [Drosophila pseudoobscura]XP_033240543.1 E3 ubiquitin-protein ligase COP1-like [Drosophila pseudoobscura]
MSSENLQVSSSTGTSTQSSQSTPNASVSSNISDGENSGSRAAPPMVTAGGILNRIVSGIRHAYLEILVRIPMVVPRNNRSDSTSNRAPEAAIGLRTPNSLSTDRIRAPSTSRRRRHASTNTATTGPTASDAEVSGPSRPKRQRTDSNESLEETYNCPICFESVSSRDPVATKCGHVFCRQCIRTVIRRFHKCPVCRMRSTLRQLKSITM